METEKKSIFSKTKDPISKYFNKLIKPKSSSESVKMWIINTTIIPFILITLGKISEPVNVSNALILVATGVIWFFSSAVILPWHYKKYFLEKEKEQKIEEEAEKELTEKTIEEKKEKLFLKLYKDLEKNKILLNLFDAFIERNLYYNETNYHSITLEEKENFNSLLKSKGLDVPWETIEKTISKEVHKKREEEIKRNIGKTKNYEETLEKYIKHYSENSELESNIDALNNFLIKNKFLEKENNSEKLLEEIKQKKNKS